MKVFVIFLVLVGLFTSSAFAFEPSYTNYFSNPEFKIYKVQENAYEFSIPYKVSNAELDKINIDCASTALIIYLDNTGAESNLIINIPRALLDMKINDKDDDFIIILDQLETEYQEIDTDSNSRTFNIPLQTDGEILEIIASSMGMFPEPIPCGVGGDDKSPYYQLLSPLEQFRSGIPFNEIQCKENLVLLQKYDGSPACVTESTKQKLIERGWAAKDNSILKTSTNCMTLEQSKETAPFFKTPTYLPEGYFHVCSQSGTPFESYIVYHHQEILNWNIPELISDGAIFIYQIDERNIVRAEKFETFGTAEQRIQADYDSVMEGNPSLQPQLIRINGMLAYAVDSCSDCGIQTANFTDGTFIQKSTSTETKIKFIDENGINYMLKTTLPLDELILVAESLQ